MPVGKGQMEIRILEDGTIRAETGDMGGVAHKAADDFLKEMARLMGGNVEIEARAHDHHHHDHEHHDDHLNLGGKS